MTARLLQREQMALDIFLLCVAISPGGAGKGKEGFIPRKSSYALSTSSTRSPNTNWRVSKTF